MDETDDVSPGVWCIYDYHEGLPTALFSFVELLEAVKHLTPGDYICWWPEGMVFHDAVDVWHVWTTTAQERRGRPPLSIENYPKPIIVNHRKRE